MLPGAYTITETPQQGWSVTINCTGATLSTVTINNSTNSVSITLAGGETVVCTFTNERVAKVDIGGKYYHAPLPGSGVGSYGFNLTNLGNSLTINMVTFDDSMPPGVTYLGIDSPNSTAGWDLPTCCGYEPGALHVQHSATAGRICSVVDSGHGPPSAGAGAELCGRDAGRLDELAERAATKHRPHHLYMSERGQTVPRVGKRVR